MTREGIELNTVMDPEDVEKIIVALNIKQIWQSLNDVAKWARLYGGGLGYIAIDGQNPATPLRIETIRKGQFQGIIAMDRWMVNPDITNGVKVPGPDFGNPEFYDVVATSFQFPFPHFRIHHTRVIRMEGISLPFWQKQTEMMWGISVLERVFDRLTAFDSTTAGASQLTYRSYLRTLQIENLRGIIAEGGQAYEAMLAQLELVRRYQANEGITLLDAKDTFETHSYTFAGLSDVINAMGDQIAGALQVPVARLFGQSPGGMNSTGDHELRTYYDNIKRLQERWFRRPLDVIIRVIAASEEVEIPDGFWYNFVSLWQLTAKEKAEINAQDVQAFTAMDNSCLPKRVLLEELRAAGRRTGYWSNITNEDIDDAAEADDADVPSPADLLAQEELSEQVAGEDIDGPADKGTGTKDHALSFFDEEEVERVILSGRKYIIYKRPEGWRFQTQTGYVSGKFPSKEAATERATKHAIAFISKDSARVFDWNGIPIHIETMKGELRRGSSPDNPWQVTMPASYGFIHGIPSAEGAYEEMDCFFGEDLDSTAVFVIDQKNLLTGAFDEHKVMLAFSDERKARDVYCAAFSDGKGPARLSSVTPMTVQGLKSWLRRGDVRSPLNSPVEDEKMRTWIVWVKGKRASTEMKVETKYKDNALIKCANRNGVKSYECDGVMEKAQ
jgi:phage-related protein (TIGR01555 family)